MAKFLLRLDDKVYEKITAKAAAAKRSLNKHIEMIIERDLVTVEGVVKDGTIGWTDEAKAEFEDYKMGRILDPRD